MAAALLVFGVAAHAQVSFSLVSSHPMTSQGATWVTKADLNSDGIPDLVCASGYALYLFTNNGDALFTYTKYLPASGPIYSVAAADLEGDGQVDLAASSGTSPGWFDVHTNVNNGGVGQLSRYAVGENPRSAAAVDVNMDGKVDLICANSGNGAGNTLSILTNHVAGVFAVASSPILYNAPYCIAAADFNNDGYPDLAIANYGLTIMTNDGHGNFAFTFPLSYFVGQGAKSVATADVNGDGLIDVVTAGLVTNSVWILTNAGNAKFSLRSVTQVGNYPSSIAPAYLDQDQRIDLAVANYSDKTVSILTNDGSGAFALATIIAVEGPPSCLIASDLNGDGKADLATANLIPATMSVFVNTPILGIIRTNQNIRLSWPAWSGWGLQVADAINSAGWLSSSYASTSDGTNKFVTIAPTNQAQFFRLAK